MKWNKKMIRSTVLSPLAVAALVALLPAGASAVQGYCFVDMGDCDEAYAVITLAGGLQLNLSPIEHPQDGQQTLEVSAITVQCWICLAGTCDSNGDVGPAVQTIDLNEDDPSQFTVWFGNSNYDNAALPVSPGNYNSYYCGMAVSGTGSLGGIFPLVEPSYAIPMEWGTERHGRALDGTQLVTVLEGSLAVPGRLEDE